ncbi:MAG: ATP-binding protein [Rhodothermales bacterium]
MRPFLPPLLLVALCGASLIACSSEGGTHDPKALPYTLVPVRNLGMGVQAADLNGDGIDEVVISKLPGGRPPGVMAVWLQTYDGRTIEQANFEGQILRLHFLDLDGDGTLETLVPYIRSDSLFLGIVDVRGRKRGGFFLVAGEPREEPEGALPWDPNIEAFYAVDADDDARGELVTVVQTGYARLPRGVLVHDLPDGEPLGQVIIGGRPESSFLSDVGGDAAPELVVSTWSPNNGAVAGGFDDAHSYVIAFDLNPALEVRWSKETGGLWSGTYVASADFDGDGHRELLICTTTASSKPEEARFEIVESGTGRTLRHRSIAEPLRWALAVDLDRDAQPEIVAVRSPDEVWVFDGRLERVQRRRIARELGTLGVWPDMDGDGVDELTVGSTEGELLLDPALRVKAIMPGEVVGVMRRGIGRSPYLLVGHGEQVWAMELVENRLWWVYRYGPLALWVLGVAGALGAVAGGRSLYQRTRLLERVYPVAVDGAANGVLVLDDAGRIVLMNAALCEWLGLAEARPVKGGAVGAVLGEAPALAAFLRQALADDPPRHHAEEVALGANGQQHVHYVAADPVALQNGRAPHWLVTLAPGRRDATYLDARLWAAMAEEITHKLRNALGAILLEAEELQVAYRQQAPASSGTLDPYTERIAERVNTLRRETLQLLSIHDVEALTLTRSDLSSVVRDVEETLARDRPPRAELRFRLEDGLPAVAVDRERMQAALENLVSNAFRAVSGGGIVTVSTYAVPNLQRAQTAFEPADYAVLEVRDNGTGIAPADLRSIFEPGFSTAEFGTGLGLALVQRIAAHHGGFVKVESEAGVGSLFSLYLPVADAGPVQRNA